jgi:proteic killer suppression protein
MIVTFEEDYLADLYTHGASKDKKHRFQPDIVRRYQRCIRYLIDARSIEALYQMHSLNYKVLSGDKVGISSIRVNDQYRVEFTVTEAPKEPVLTICNILELSNHYK